MSELLMLVKLARENTSDTLIAGVLADWYQEYEGLAPFAARRKALAIQRAERNAEQLTVAAMILSKTSPMRAHARFQIDKSCGPMPSFDFTIILVVGGRPPKLHHIHENGYGEFWHLGIVTVGARWLLQSVDEIIGRPGCKRLAKKIRKALAM